jgi:Type II secretion system (T2SS), protein G
MRLRTAMRLSLVGWLVLYWIGLWVSYNPIICLGCSKVKNDAYSIVCAIETFHATNARFALNLEELVRSRHLRSFPRDPWKRPYRHWIDPQLGGLFIGTFGRDGQPGGRFADSDWLLWLPLSLDHPYAPYQWLQYPASYGFAHSEPPALPLLRSLSPYGSPLPL